MRRGCPPGWRTLASLLFLIAGAGHAEVPVSVDSAMPGERTACRQSGKTVPCPDAYLIGHEGSALVDKAFDEERFDKLDALFAGWCQGKDKFADGSWKLAQFAAGLQEHFYKRNRSKLKAWQKAKPNSAAAAYADAVYWHTQAWVARGVAHGRPVTRESLALFAEDLEKSRLVLATRSRDFGTCPAWAALQIEVLAGLGKGKQARAVFDEGIAAFPGYHPLYLAMAHAYSPELGGSAAAVDAFAREAVVLGKGFEGKGLYARIYQSMDSVHELPFLPGHSATPSWPLLRDAYSDLLAAYPDSYLLANAFASVACRSGDGALYRRQRTRANGYLLQRAFSMSSTDACDLKHGWRP